MRAWIPRASVCARVYFFVLPGERSKARDQVVREREGGVLAAVGFGMLGGWCRLCWGGEAEVEVSGERTSLGWR